jgi:putative transposase
LVFCPKYRNRILKDEIGEYAKREIQNLLRQKEGIEIIEMNVQFDHVHRVMWVPPKYSISDVMGYLKGKLAIRLFQKYEKVGKRLWGRHLWSRGYCVSTIGINEEQIRQYVRWQEKQEKEVEKLQGKLFD